MCKIPFAPTSLHLKEEQMAVFAAAKREGTDAAQNVGNLYRAESVVF